MLATMLLMFNVLSTIDIPTSGGGPLGVYPIAMSVMVAHLFLIPIDGCSINPTRSFGPSLVAAWAGIGGDYYHQQYMFWFGPLFGAGLGAFLYEYGPLKPENFSGGGDMGDALFQANKGKGKDDSKKKTKERSHSIVGSKNRYLNAADPANITEIEHEDDNADYEESTTAITMTKSPIYHSNDD